MNQRLSLLLAVAATLVLMAAWRLGCRSSSEVATQGGAPPELAQIETIRREKSSANVPQLTNWAAHENPQVARAAVVALGEIPGTEPRAALQKLAEPSSPPPVRAAAIGALAQGGSEAIDVPKLIAVMGSDRDPLARAAAARGLAHYSNPERNEALRPFLKALSDADPQVRSWAIRGVHNISVKRFLFDPTAEPAKQRQQVIFIENRLKQLKVLR